jgi:NitT/TauT family transport system substrate-binding protein
MKINRRLFFLPFVSACAKRPPAQLQKVAVSVGPFHTMSPLYLAYERGYFREAGIDLDIRPTRNSVEALPLVARGVLDAGLFSLMPGVVNAIAKGAKLRLVAAREHFSPCTDTGVIYRRKDRFPTGGHDASSWRGRRITLSTKTSTTDFAIDNWRKSLGLPFDGIDRRYMDRAGSLAALLSGSVDALANGFALPLNLGGKQSQIEIIDTPRALLDGVQFSNIYFAERLLSNLDLAAGFMAAYTRGTREYIAGANPKFLEDWIVQNQMDRQLVLAACRQSFAPDGAVHAPDVQRQIDWFVERGYCEQAVPAAALIDTRWQRSSS